MSLSPAERRRCAALGAALLLSLLGPALARAHWIKPEEIIAGIKQDDNLRRNLGVVDARADPRMPRMLVIEIRRDAWDEVAADKRLGVAGLWYETWRHNVDQGIVAIVDAKTGQSLVHFDPAGRPQLVDEP